MKTHASSPARRFVEGLLGQGRFTFTREEAEHTLRRSPAATYMALHRLVRAGALVEIFQEPILSNRLLLRGGTALHKLLINPPRRYSEDIDLVQVSPGPIGPVLDAIRARLDPILGLPRREHNPDNVTLRYRMESEIPPVVPIRLKVEINTREHFAVFGPSSHPLNIRSPWFEGRAEVRIYTLDEILATKLRALYQRRKGRDLFDLWIGIGMKPVDPKKVIHAFRRYLEAEGSKVTRGGFQTNVAAKIESRSFNDDLRPLLAPGIRYDASEAAEVVSTRLLSLL